jgi:hypothetical protein
MRRFDTAPASAAGVSLSLSGATIDDRGQVLSDSDIVRRNYFVRLTAASPHCRECDSIGTGVRPMLKAFSRQQPCNYQAGSAFLHLPPVFTID